ncbi:MAG: hypothetical protein Q9N34_02590 [Aquificota bacterium]|nr:hypothetical protein [Aquificota bacterium]
MWGVARGCGLILFMVLISFSSPLDKAIELFETEYKAYSYTMKVNHDGEEGADMVLRYHYLSPGFVRMEMGKTFKRVVLT